VMLYH